MKVRNVIAVSAAAVALSGFAAVPANAAVIAQVSYVAPSQSSASRQVRTITGSTTPILVASAN